MIEAMARSWGAVAASSLVIGALLAIARDWPDQLVGLVLAFGAGRPDQRGVLRARRGRRRDRRRAAVGIGLAVGALTYFFSIRGSRPAARTPQPRSRSAPSSTACPSSSCLASG